MNKLKAGAGVLAIVAASVLLSRPTATPVVPGMEDRQKELIDKVSLLSLKGTFEKYDADKSGKLDRKELDTLLYDAGVGTWATRGMWIDGMLKALDTDKDGKISWDELTRALK